jgi:hypothetical protein
MLVSDSRTSSATGAFGRHERHDSEVITLVTAGRVTEDQFVQRHEHGGAVTRRRIIREFTWSIQKQEGFWEPKTNMRPGVTLVFPGLWLDGRAFR